MLPQFTVQFRLQPRRGIEPRPKIQHHRRHFMTVVQPAQARAFACPFPGLPRRSFAVLLACGSGFVPWTGVPPLWAAFFASSPRFFTSSVGPSVVCNSRAIAVPSRAAAWVNARAVAARACAAPGLAGAAVCEEPALLTRTCGVPSRRTSRSSGGSPASATDRRPRRRSPGIFAGVPLLPAGGDGSEGRAARRRRCDRESSSRWRARFRRRLR